MFFSQKISTTLVPHLKIFFGHFCDHKTFSSSKTHFASYFTSNKHHYKSIQKISKNSGPQGQKEKFLPCSLPCSPQKLPPPPEMGERPQYTPESFYRLFLYRGTCQRTIFLKSSKTVSHRIKISLRNSPPVPPPALSLILEFF